jgi:hypothetical protein
VQEPIGKNLASSSSGTRRKKNICFQQGHAARENIVKACGFNKFKHHYKMLQKNSASIGVGTKTGNSPSTIACTKRKLNFVVENSTPRLEKM